MNLSERCNYFWSIFVDLQATNSIIEKRLIVRKIPEWLTEDFQYIIECLNGKHKFGYTYPAVYSGIGPNRDMRNVNNTVKEVLQFLQEPRLEGDLSEVNIYRHVSQTFPLGWFFSEIVNRTLKLGIGNSILPKDGFAPMLAKKFEGKMPYDSRGYIITEKLDGNRCIAVYENDRWMFYSRNGKVMHVNFDMGDLPKEFVYDGEVMSKSQTISSMKLNANILYGTCDFMIYGNEFNATSGMINRHSGEKDLVYNIFDIMLDDVEYVERRRELNAFEQVYKFGNDVRILPVIITSDSDNLERITSDILGKVCNMGGEGIMINCGSGLYTHKRTNQLLKLKQVQSIDMKVIDVQEGSGKYEYMIGSLDAICQTDDGKMIMASIGSGLSDEQRSRWWNNPSDIIGRVIEVQYFSMSQNADARGTDNYSLRFPRLKTVRYDKTETSQY